MSISLISELALRLDYVMHIGAYRPESGDSVDAEVITPEEDMKANQIAIKFFRRDLLDNPSLDAEQKTLPELVICFPKGEVIREFTYQFPKDDGVSDDCKLRDLVKSATKWKFFKSHEDVRQHFKEAYIPTLVAHPSFLDLSLKEMEISLIPEFTMEDLDSCTEAVLERLAFALHDVGFFVVTNARNFYQAYEEAVAPTKDFFALSLDEKMECDATSNGGQRGFVSLERSEKAKGRKVKDVKEFFHIGPELTEKELAQFKYPKNIWPRKSTDFQEKNLRLYKALIKCAFPVQKVLSMLLYGDQVTIEEMTKFGPNLMRSIHYPDYPVDEQCSIRDQFWAAPHTDIDLFAILPAPCGNGLQVKLRDGTWVNVKTKKDAFIVNAGDFLQNLTNGYFRSAEHRVVKLPGIKERFSTVIFIHPKSHLSMAPLEKFVSKTGGTVLYPTASAGDLLLERLVSLGLATPEMIAKLAQSESCLIEQQIKLGTADEETLKSLQSAGFVTTSVIN